MLWKLSLSKIWVDKVSTTLVRWVGSKPIMAVLGKGLSHVLGRVKQNVQDCVTRLKTACDIKLVGDLVLKMSI